MGEPILFAYGVLALLGIALIVLGAFRHASNLIVAGSAILFALAGAWVLGLVGVAAGLLPLGFFRRGPRNGST